MYDTLVDLKVLQKHSTDHGWCVVDCRASLADAGYGSAAYVAGHIPGAVFADLARDLSGPIVAGVTGRHPLPEPATLAHTFGTFGIDSSTQVVAYDADNGAYAARLWWLLRWLGHTSVAVLDGGLAAWSSAGLPLVAGAQTRAATDFPVRAALTRSVSAAEVAGVGAAYALLDARSEARYRGEFEPIDPVAGHIPGAICMPFDRNLGPTGHFLSPDALRARFAGIGRDVVCYCGSGVTACHNILAMRHADLPEPALYAGSFSEWITDPTRPVAR